MIEIKTRWRRQNHRLECYSSLALVLAWRVSTNAQVPAAGQYEFNDSHFHLTNYIQEGTDIHDFLKIMGTKVGRVALFGIPLQQEWSYRQFRGLRADLLPADRRTALLLLLHRCLHRDGISIPFGRAAGTLRSHDYRL